MLLTSDIVVLIEWYVFWTVLASPWIAGSLAVGYLVGRYVERPLRAGVSSAGVGAAVLWASLSASVIIIDDGPATTVDALFLGGYALACFSPFYIAMALRVWLDKANGPSRETESYEHLR